MEKIHHKQESQTLHGWVDFSNRKYVAIVKYEIIKLCRGLCEM